MRLIREHKKQKKKPQVQPVPPIKEAEDKIYYIQKKPKIDPIEINMIMNIFNKLRVGKFMKIKPYSLENEEIYDEITDGYRRYYATIFKENNADHNSVLISRPQVVTTGSPYLIEQYPSSYTIINMEQPATIKMFIEKIAYKKSELKSALDKKYGLTQDEVKYLKSFLKDKKKM
jgi:hypothetical protein